MSNRRTIIVTGGAKGIGYACVRRFFDDGDNVVIADTDKEAGKEAGEEGSKEACDQEEAREAICQEEGNP